MCTVAGACNPASAKTWSAWPSATQIIDVFGHKPRRIPSAKWRELIKKVWLVLRSEGSLR